MDCFAKKLKPKRFELLSQIEQIRLKNDYDEAKELLQTSLNAYDQKRSALPWLYQDYYLTLAVYQIDQLMQAVAMAKQNFKRKTRKLTRRTLNSDVRY